MKGTDVELLFGFLTSGVGLWQSHRHSVASKQEIENLQKQINLALVGIGFLFLISLSE